MKRPKKIFSESLNYEKISFDKNDTFLIQGDAFEVLDLISEKCIDLIFADPPYFLSNGGITCQSGEMVSVDKGDWDKAKTIENIYNFNYRWLKQCQNHLSEHGSIWISGTYHNIYSIGYAMQQLGYKILNVITWFKRNAPPNLSCRYFTHSTEQIIWAKKNDNAKHIFNYEYSKTLNNGKQMRDVWDILPPRSGEKKFGKHPTQKPIELLKRIILSSSEKDSLVMDPFMGSGTTGIAALTNNRDFIGIESNKKYCKLAKNRIKNIEPVLL